MEAIFDKTKLVHFLGNISLFLSADPSILSLLAEKTNVKSYDSGETVIRKGDEGHTMFMILSGRLKVHDEAHEVAKLESGEIFGELSLLDSEPRSMSVTTMENTILGSISRNDFYDVLKKFPEIIKDIISVLSKRLRNQNYVLITEYRTREAQLKKLVDIRTAEVMRQKEELEIKNAVIAEKNKEMTDSLNYAQRLQMAILPKKESITQVLEKSFVLYMPKDIVSGDFYLFQKVDDVVVVAAADCTGHGVAGAIMSMIGSSLLRQLIIEKKIVNPADILNQLNTGVIEALHQTESHANDGMDISVCTFDFSSRILHFAGANRPLWIVRDGALEVIKSDKFPIGGMQFQHSGLFTNHQIPLQDKDAIYLTTDGYADQFGGPSGKKLMTKKMKELILSFQHKPMHEQGKHLQEYIVDWMGNQSEQTDDMMVIGIKV